MSKAVAGNAGGGEAVGDLRRAVVEKDRDPVVVAEVARRREGAQVDGVEILKVAEVHDQPQRPGTAHGLHDRAP